MNLLEDCNQNKKIEIQKLKENKDFSSVKLNEPNDLKSELKSIHGSEFNPICRICFSDED